MPVTRLYDRGITVTTSPLLKDRTGEPFVALHPGTAESLGAEAGQRVSLSLNGRTQEVAVKIDGTIPAGVALVPRSMGLRIESPAEARVQVPVGATK